MMKRNWHLKKVKQALRRWAQIVMSRKLSVMSSSNTDLLRRILDNDRCTIELEGTYTDEVNWMTGTGTPGGIRTIHPEIEDQGNTDFCWAFSAVELCAAIFRLFGDDSPKLSIQQLIDAVFPERDYTEGNGAATLQWVKDKGLFEAGVYGPYTGVQAAHDVAQERADELQGEVARRIVDWSLLADKEMEILEALRSRALMVSVPAYEAFRYYEGRRLLDLFEAETRAKLKNPSEHIVVLVGFGVFTPSDPAFQHLKLQYYVLKNSWGIDWGDGGVGYILTQSSLLEVERLRKSLSEARLSEAGPSTKRRRTSTKLQKSLYLAPLCAYMDDCPEPRTLLARSPVQETTGFTIDGLYKMITNKANLRDRLIYMFYDPAQCQNNGVHEREIFNALGKLYKYDENARLRLVDISVHDKAVKRFKLTEGMRVELLAYLPEVESTFGRPQRKKYAGNFTFGAIMLWIGDEVGGYDVVGVKRLGATVSSLSSCGL